MLKKLYLFFLFIIIKNAYSQQDSQYTQYMYNPLVVNPAYAGSRDLLSIFLLHREQWVGLDGAPVTNNVSIHTPIGVTNWGVGLTFVNDRIGPTEENTISADITYFIPVSQQFKLSLGVQATANLFSLNTNKLNIYHQNDPEFQNFKNEFSPNIGAGIYLYSNNTYFGFSVPNISETNAYNDNSVAIFKEKLHYYFMAGHVFSLHENLDFKPAFLSKVVEGAPLQLDLTANFLINSKLTLGMAYRWDSAISGLAGFQISKSWFIGYGYDAETTHLSNYNSGSHEIFLRYEISTTNRITSPRFF
ncbi:type IX secretion system membrane protein PorP/SprF [Flavobacterium sp. J27]|uniref:PorP/SprF family type IX secretion system membrane protein n=1 Tax=Flavobacterium sp. J27 TaxID=2060419 RepID=UPI00103062B2|nr:type IX secretion system membrane protein PorP/SprF [Flavobacterium sp. J27]